MVGYVFLQSKIPRIYLAGFRSGIKGEPPVEVRVEANMHPNKAPIPRSRSQGRKGRGTLLTAHRTFLFGDNTLPPPLDQKTTTLSSPSFNFPQFAAHDIRCYLSEIMSYRAASSRGPLLTLLWFVFPFFIFFFFATEIYPRLCAARHHSVFKKTGCQFYVCTYPKEGKGKQARGEFGSGKRFDNFWGGEGGIRPFAGVIHAMPARSSCSHGR